MCFGTPRSRVSPSRPAQTTSGTVSLYIGLPVPILTRLGGGPAEVGQLFVVQGATAAVSVLLVGGIATEGRDRPLLAGSMRFIAAGFALVLLAPNLLAVGVVRGTSDS